MSVEQRGIANYTEAVSMSWRVARVLRQEGWEGEILAVHPRSCYLVGENGDIHAIVPDTLGNGPLNLVIPAAGAEHVHALSQAALASSTGSRLILGQFLEIGLEQAALWDPKAHPALGADLERLRRSLTALYRTASTRAPERSLSRLLPYLRDEDLPEPLQAVGHFPRSHALIGGLVESLVRRSRRSMKVVASSLAGLGPGLTPSGDDFLAGILLALALTQEDRVDADLAEMAQLLLDTVAPRTHEISAAYLRTAFAGEASERWHVLLGAVAAGDAPGMTAAALQIMTVGETSGADMLAGFLAGMDVVYGSFPEAARGVNAPSPS